MVGERSHAYENMHRRTLFIPGCTVGTMDLRKIKPNQREEKREKTSEFFCSVEEAFL